jgi:hypothetical protein
MMRNPVLARAGVLFGVTLLALAACEQPTTFDLEPQFNKGKKSGGGNPAAEFVFSTPAGFGVFGVGGPYVHQQDGVQAYMGVDGKNVNLTTNGTPRTLRYVFPSSSAFGASGISSSDFESQTVVFGINWSMRYTEMQVGSVGRVKADFEFYDGRVGYELVYYNLAVQRLSDTEWLITTDCAHLPAGCWNYGFDINADAELNTVRRRKQQAFGAVNMPVTFTVTLLD